MSEQLYRVVFTGAFTGEFDEPDARERFKKLFKLNDKQLARLFSGDEHVIKNNVSEDIAMRFMIRVLEAGCECYVQEMPDDDEVPYEEKRRGGERRIRFRRGPRPGAIVQDRRIAIRRKRDRRQYRELAKSDMEMPLAFQPYSTDAGEEPEA